MKYTLINPQEYDEVIKQILHNRGVEDKEHYLNTTDDDILTPSLLDNIEDGVKMLISHIHNDDDIMIIVDPDVDGFTSSAVLINYLNLLFPSYTQTKIHYVLHTGKQHGLQDMMEYLEKHPECNLIICPDSASNDYEYHSKLKNDGKDILVLDHHMAEKVSDDACVINNQLCDYPTKSLSGVGIVYKFCCYIDSLLNINLAENFIDLTMLGLKYQLG